MMTAVFWIICIIVFLIVVTIGHRNIKKNGKFDERQEMIRNRGYKYGFVTMVVVSVIVLYLNIFNVKVPNALAVTIPFYFGCFVTSIYDVINQAYFRIREQHATKNGVLLIVVGIIEAYFAVGDFMQKEWFTFTNFAMLALYLIVIGSAILYVNYRNKRDEE